MFIPRRIKLGRARFAFVWSGDAPRRPGCTAFRGGRAWVLLGAAMLVGGCSTYHPKPLDRSAVEAALAPPSLEQVRIAAARLNQPLLKPIVIDGRDGFTPDELAVIAVIASPQLRALRDQRGVAQAQVMQAGLLPNPQISYALDQTHDPGFVNGKTLGLSWEVTSLLGYRDRVAGAKAGAGALDLGIAWQEWQVAQAARLHALRVLSLEARVGLANETETVWADALALARRSQTLGLTTAGDLTAATETWSTAQNSRFALEQELVGERTALALAVGQPADVPVKIKPVPPAPAPSFSAGAAAELLQGMETRRLDLVALAVGYESAEASLRAAVKAQFPKISLNLARASDTSDVHTRGFGITVDLPVFDRNQGQIALGEATRQQLFDEYVVRITEARAEVRQILAKLDVLRTQLGTVEAGLPALEQQSAALDEAMRSRNADAQAWREARGALLLRRSEHAQLRQEQLELEVALEIATGRVRLAGPGQAEFPP